MSVVGNGFDLAPGAEPWSDFHWFQASPRSVLKLVVLSKEPVHYVGHYIGGRMVPCFGEGCDCCAAAIAGQIRYCVAVAEVMTRRLGLLELGRGNGLLLRDWIGRFGKLDGMCIEVSKASKSPQSRTILAYVESDGTAPVHLLQAPDPSLALYLTWRKMGIEMPSGFREAMSGKLSKVREPVG